MPAHRAGGGEFGINLIGFASANLGLGAALRNTASILEGLGIPFCVLDVALPDGRSGHDHSLRGRYHQGGATPYPVNLFHLNPPELASLLNNPASGVPVAGKMNVCVPFWELPKFPAGWLRILAAMDMVLAPTRFIAAALGELDKTPVRPYPQGLREIPEARPDRKRWGIDAGQTAFLVSFELSSDLHRKNPAAAMLAFTRAFQGSQEAVLIIKLNNGGLNAASRAAAEGIKRVAESMGNALVIDTSLPYGDLMSLYASVDVYVSLHRGEGLGLSLMESMCLGKPVITTGWSGNMDFCDDANSCLVKHALVPVHADSAYKTLCEGAEIQWAEPDVDEASAWMARLAGDPGLRTRIGANAREAIGRFLAESRRGAVFASLRAYHERLHPPAQPHILLQNRDDMDELPGGDSIVVHNVRKALVQGGAAAGISLKHDPSLSDWDIVQLVNITRARDTRNQLRNARAQGKPIGLISLYEDLDLYIDLATRVSLVYKLFAAQGRPTTPEHLLESARMANMNIAPLDEPSTRALGIGDKAAQQEILSGADWVFTSGRTETESLKARFRIQAPVTEIPFGIDPAFRKADGRLFTGKYGFKDFTLAVGRLELRKNTWNLIEIFRAWPDKQLVLIGYMDSEADTESIRRYAPRNVFFMGKLPREEVVSAYAAARLHVLASWYELPGLVSLEAGAAGSRVVTTSWGTARDCLGERAHYCQPDDPDSIRKAILEAYDSRPHPELRDFIIETYDWRRTAERMREAYGTLLSTKANQAIRTRDPAIGALRGAGQAGS